ncbi:MAG TPA: YebC/PmpR family DNA-binding transcriptional regulator, partial [Prolixibacteraceae bacterium]|nr:YebC/PmpR family DNA-binding transcriptional regulator [Prolixibacteraceae bacterium]
EAQKVELQRIPKVDKRLAVEEAKVVMRMIEELEDNEDVQNVYHNLEMTEELERALEEE